MPQWLTTAFWEEELAPAIAWLDAHVFNLLAVFELAAIAVAFGLGKAFARPLKRSIAAFGAQGGWQGRLAYIGGEVAMPCIWLLLIELVLAVARAAGQPFYILKIAASLLTAWVVITIIADFVRNRALARFIAVAAWTIAALNILGLLDPTAAVLGNMAFTIGEVRISALNIISALLIFVILFWLALSVAALLDQQLSRSTSITPSLQMLFSKLAKIALIALALILGMTASGINLTAFAVFGGAVGLGLGFGLQRPASNLVSGLILLLDRSIKPGDVIEFGNTYGWINKLAARYTSVVTRSGTEYLIPNEDMITQPVINWSHSNRQVRRAIPLRIAYGCDVRKAMALTVEAAKETDRILASPAPACLMKGFGESAIDLELRVWIEDPQNGVSNVASDVLLRIWDKFKANDIDIPLPQRYVHVVPAASENLPAEPVVRR